MNYYKQYIHIYIYIQKKKSKINVIKELNTDSKIDINCYKISLFDQFTLKF